MANAQEPFKLTLTQDVIDVLSVSRGRVFTADDLRAIAVGKIKLIAPIGCLKGLGYADDGQSLSSITFDFDKTFTTADIKNLNDFRNQFEAAVNHGHGVSFVYNEPEKQMMNFSMYPCMCICKTAEPPKPPFQPIAPEVGPATEG